MIKLLHLILFVSTFMVPAVHSQNSLDFAFVVPEGFKLMEQSEYRAMYQNNRGHTFAYNFGKQTIEKENELDVLVPIYMYTLSLSMDDFELWAHGKDFVVNDQNYYWMEYVSSSGENELYHFSYVTTNSKKLITLAFACPIEDADAFAEVVVDVLSSIEYI
ncbi:MAG: hypothetical protein EA392_06960, partial [Cryomorphaceae bacterium]